LLESNLLVKIFIKITKNLQKHGIGKNLLCVDNALTKATLTAK